MALAWKARSPILAMLLAGLVVLVVQVTARAEPVAATYYGTWFAGKPTASGEPYNPYGYTAAHPHLPFGTKLLVRYNGKGVIVRVNDRLPYDGDYDLDLSLAAAQAIGLTEVGTATVDAQVIESQPAA